MNVDSIARDDTVPPGALALTEVISAEAGRVDRVDTEISRMAIASAASSM